MKLTELLLNRFLYKNALQNLETKDVVYESSNNIPAEVPAIASGGAAQDINISNVTINGDRLTPGTFPQTVLDVSNWGWGQTSAFSSASGVQVNWGSGSFISADGTTYLISAGNTGTMSAKTYIYLDLNVSTTTYQHSTNPADSVGVGKVLVAVAQNASSGNATYNLNQASQIVGDNILANSINASKITTGQLIVGTNVGLGTAQDSSGVTTIIGNTVTTGFVNALAVVAGSVAAENITGTTITGKTIVGSTLSTATSGQRTVLTSTLVDFYDSTGTLVAATYANSNTYQIICSNATGLISLVAGSSSGHISFGCNGETLGLIWDGADLYPGTSGVRDIGNISQQWRDLWMNGSMVYQGINQPVIYFGTCSGTTISDDNNVPFALYHDSTGKYHLTFTSLGTYAIVVTPRAGPGVAYSAEVASKTNIRCDIIIFDDTGVARDSDFMFILTQLTTEA